MRKIGEYYIPDRDTYSVHQGLLVPSIELERLQKSLLFTLRTFHVFAIENDIRYTIWGANLASLYTSGTFFPWDDDLDVMVHPDDFQKVICLWNSARSGNAEQIRTSGGRRMLKVLTFELERAHEVMVPAVASNNFVVKMRDYYTRDSFIRYPGGLDIVSMVMNGGDWVDTWCHDLSVSPSDIENEIEIRMFCGLEVSALTQSVGEPFLDEKYGDDRKSEYHPNLWGSTKEDRSP